MAEPAREIVDARGEQVLRFPEGIVGFPGAQRFTLLESSQRRSPFRSLVCLDLPDLRFIVCDPGTFGVDYGADLVPPPDTAPGDVAVMVIVTVRPSEITANLMAPLVVDIRTRTGRQLVIDTGRYSTRHAFVSSSPAT